MWESLPLHLGSPRLPPAQPRHLTSGLPPSLPSLLPLSISLPLYQLRTHSPLKTHGAASSVGAAEHGSGLGFVLGNKQNKKRLRCAPILLHGSTRCARSELPSGITEFLRGIDGQWRERTWCHPPHTGQKEPSGGISVKKTRVRGTRLGIFFFLFFYQNGQVSPDVGRRSPHAR